jgi:hypothetical protein
MTEVFRERIVESPVAPEIAPQATKPIEVEDVPGYAKKVQDEPTREEETLDIWEGLNRRKYGHDYFNIREFAHEFPIKANFGLIDKYVKGEIEERGYEKNIENWKKVIQEIESEIGSSRLETFSRIQKIVGYIKAVQRLEDAKAKKKLYELRDF